MFYRVNERDTEMEIKSTIWIAEIERKVIMKHNVQPYEVDELLANNPYFRFVEKGRVQGEDMYFAMGQADSGRYLVAFFIYKGGQEALMISARDMSERERKAYDRAKK